MKRDDSGYSARTRTFKPGLRRELVRPYIFCEYCHGSTQALAALHLNNTRSFTPESSSWTSPEHGPLSDTLLSIIEEGVTYKTAHGFLQAFFIYKKHLVSDILSSIPHYTCCYP